MKINPGWQPVKQQMVRADVPVAERSNLQDFAQLLNQGVERAASDTVLRSMQQIQLQGDRLMKSMTLRELREYKRMIQKFLEYVVRSGIGTAETKGWDRRGRGKRYLLLQELDRSLLDLTDELLDHEHGRVELLYRIGEIRGLLINLLF